MTFDPFTQNPQNKSQLIKWNRVRAGERIFHIRRILDSEKCIAMSGGELMIFKPGTTACLYKNNGENYRSDYKDCTFEFAPDHYTKVYLNPSNGRTYIAEYWYRQEEGVHRFVELQQQVPVQSA